MPPVLQTDVKNTAHDYAWKHDVGVGSCSSYNIVVKYSFPYPIVFEGLLDHPQVCLKLLPVYLKVLASLPVVLATAVYHILVVIVVVVLVLFVSRS